MKQRQFLIISISALFYCCGLLAMDEKKYSAENYVQHPMVLMPPETFEKFPLHWAAASGDKAFVNTAVSNGAQDPNEYDSLGRLPIEYARANGYTEIVAILTREAEIQSLQPNRNVVLTITPLPPLIQTQPIEIVIPEQITPDDNQVHPIQPLPQPQINQHSCFGHWFCQVTCALLCLTSIGVTIGIKAANGKS